MNTRLVPLALALSSVASAALADTGWSVTSLPSQNRAARAILFQGDRDAAPEWAVLDGYELTVAELSGGPAPHKILLPPATTLFDLRDTDRDGRPELAAIRGGKLEYWPDASLGKQADPAFSIADPTLQAISYGAPRPYPLFVDNRGEDFVCIPVGARPALFTLEGIRADTELAPAATPPTLAQFNAWRSAPSPIGGPASQELHINQVFDPTPSAAPTVAGAPKPSTRRARDAAMAPPDEWPSFQLGNGMRVYYALAPPDFQDTLIGVESAAPGENRRAVAAPSPRRFPGILIPPADGATDFDGDGLNDLLLWRAPRPGASVDSLVRAAQDGVWDIVLTVHLFSRATGRFTARPIEWIHTQAPVMNVLEGSVRGPFTFMQLDDLDGDGRADLVCTGAGREISAWKFTGSTVTRPWVSATLPESIEDVVLTARVPTYRWLGIARSAHAFHLLALPNH